MNILLPSQCEKVAKVSLTHPTGSLAAAARALDLAINDVEGICADLVDAEMIERARMQ